MSSIGFAVGIPFTTIRGVRVGQYLLYSDGVVTWRKGARGGYFVLDKTLDATGFDGAEDVNWENVKTTTVSFLEDFDGNSYMTVVIGTQEWMVGNLKTTHYDDGTVIPHIVNDVLWDADTTGAYCSYDHDDGNVTTYGLLYNWYAVNNVHDLAPNIAGGWRIATSADWTTLANYVDVLGLTDAADELKEEGTTHWISDNGTNDYGFTMLPGGLLQNSGTFTVITSWAYFWTSVGIDVDNAYCSDASDGSNTVTIEAGAKLCGMSVRCVRDV
jgi:uncharacterized protein (TIGR02145 family)